MNLTQDPLPGLLRRLAWPAALGFLFNTLFNVIDTAYGGLLGTGALAALSLSFPLFLVLLAVGSGLGSGAGSLIANALGAGQAHRAVRLQIQALGLGFGVAVLVSAGLILGLEPILRAFQAEGELLDQAWRYTAVLLAAGPFFVTNFLLNAGLSARGDTKSFRNFLILGTLLNLGLDPLLLFGLKVGGWVLIPELRETGIALATLLIQIFGTVFLYFRALKAGAMKHPHWDDIRPHPGDWAEIFSQGLPASLNMLTMALGTFLINAFVSPYGPAALAAYGTAIRIEQIALLPVFGLNVALAALVGQNNGAGRLDRVAEAYRLSLVYAAGVTVAVLVPVLALSGWLFALFSRDPEVVRLGTEYLWIQAITFFSYVLMNQSNSVLQGLKRPQALFWVGLYRQLPAPWLIFTWFTGLWGLTGVWWGLVVVNWSAALFTGFWTLRQLKSAQKGA